MRITTASTADADAVADLWVELADDQQRHGSHLLGEANRPAIREAILQRTVTDDLLVARRDGRILGFVMYTIEGGRYEQDVTLGLVENLYVRSDSRRDGIGSALLDGAEQRLTDAGATAITIEAMADNEAAREFYATHGYEPHRVELEKSMESDTS